MFDLGFRALVRLLIKESDVVTQRTPRGGGTGHPIPNKPEKVSLGSPGEHEPIASDESKSDSCGPVKVSRAFTQEEEREDGLGYQPYP